MELSFGKVIQSTGIQQVFRQLYQTVRSSLYGPGFHTLGHGYLGRNLSSRQWTTEKHTWCAIVKIWCSLSHRAGVASTYSESKKHNPALEVEKNNSKKSKIAKRMARLDELCVRQAKLNEELNE